MRGYRKTRAQKQGVVLTTWYIRVTHLRGEGRMVPAAATVSANLSCKGWQSQTCPQAKGKQLPGLSGQSSSCSGSV